MAMPLPLKQSDAGSTPAPVAIPFTIKIGFQMTTLEALQVAHDYRNDLQPGDAEAFIATLIAVLLTALEKYPITDFYPSTEQPWS